MKSFLGLVLLMSFSAVLGQRTPTISHITQEQIKDIGGVVELDCSVQYAQEYPVLWMKISAGRPSDPLPVSTGPTLIIRDSRFALRYDPSSSTYTLQIKDIQETDAGIYQCQVIIALNNKESADVLLQVRRPSVISDNSTRSVIVSEGQQVTLECYASGYPAPRISWRRENNAILPTGGSMFRGNILQIMSVKEEDRGTYYCVAENGVGKAARRDINVEVELSLVTILPGPQGQALLAETLNKAMSKIAKMQSEIDSIKTENIGLKQEVERLDSERRRNNIIMFNVQEGKNKNLDEGNILKIISVKKEDRGTYYCVAENGVGKGTRRNINVEVEFSPVITVPRPRLGQALQYDMDLECHVEAYPPPAIVWIKEDEERQIANNQHFSVSHFATADEFTDTTLRVITIEKRQYGYYKCKAINKLGAAEAKVHLFETVVPVCPPACGQARYSSASATDKSMVAFLLIPLMIFGTRV